MFSIHEIVKNKNKNSSVGWNCYSTLLNNCEIKMWYIVTTQEKALATSALSLQKD
jgi:hypothetical protein